MFYNDSLSKKLCQFQKMLEDLQNNSALGQGEWFVFHH